MGGGAGGAGAGPSSTGYGGDVKDRGYGNIGSGVFSGDMGAFGQPSTGWGYLDSTINNMVNNPIATALNFGAGFAPVFGQLNTLSGAIGGPTFGGIATSLGRAATGYGSPSSAPAGAAPMGASMPGGPVSADPSGGGMTPPGGQLPGGPPGGMPGNLYGSTPSAFQQPPQWARSNLDYR